MKQNLFIAFQSRQFLYLWIAEIFTQIPVNLLNFLLILVVFELTKKNTAVSAIVLSFTLPAVFFGILAGVYIDKWNKKYVLFFANIIRAVLLVLLAFFHQNVYAIFLISFLFSIVTQFFIPAESPLIPLIVKEKQLLSANAWFSIGIFASILIAYLASAPFLLYFGFVKTLFILAAMLLIGGFLISLITVPKSEEKKSFQFFPFSIPLSEIKRELMDVAGIVIKTRQVSTSLFLLALSQILILILASIAPGYASEVLHIHLEEFPLFVITPATIGIVVGAVFIANRLGNVEKSRIVNVGIFLSAFVMITLPFCNRIASREIAQTMNIYLPSLIHVTNIHLIIVLAFLLGLANSFVFVPSNTILQEQTTDEIRGKLYGVMNTLVGILSFMPILLVGSFSDLIGVSSVAIGVGLVLFIIGILKVRIGRNDL